MQEQGLKEFTLVSGKAWGMLLTSKRQKQKY